MLSTLAAAVQRIQRLSIRDPLLWALSERNGVLRACCIGVAGNGVILPRLKAMLRLKNFN